jgi:hypothetical protein
MNSIVPSPRGQVRASSATKLTVLARIPDVFVEANRATDSSAEYEAASESTSEELTSGSARPVAIAQPKSQEDRTKGHAAQRNRRAVQRPSGKGTSKFGKNRGKPITEGLSRMHWVLLAVVGFLLIVVVVLLTRQNQPQPVEHLAPNWPPTETNNEFAGPSSNDEAPAPGANPLNPTPSQAIGSNGETQPAGTDALQPGIGLQPAPVPAESGGAETPGVVRLNGTIGTPDRQAHQPPVDGPIQ